MINEIPKIYLEADTFTNLPSVTKVLNVYEMEYYIWIHIPEHLSRHFNVYQLDELVKNVYNEVGTEGYLHRDDYHPWLRITSGILNKDVGQHIYRLSLVDVATHDVCALYFSYILHSDVVDKPYAYMKDACLCDEITGE